MVRKNGHIRQKEAVAPERILSTTVRLGEIIDAGWRLEASAFNIEARRAIAQLKASGLPLIPLYGPEGLCHEAHNAFRFKRIYVRPESASPSFPAPTSSACGRK